GDVLLLEPTGFATSDVLRFNPAGTGSAGYPASMVFYSDKADAATEAPAPADTGFPTDSYTNFVSIREVVSSPGVHTATYTPTANQPGFIPGFAVTYSVISSVPEPGPMALGACAAVAGLAGAWLRRKRATA